MPVSQSSTSGPTGSVARLFSGGAERNNSGTADPKQPDAAPACAARRRSRNQVYDNGGQPGAACSWMKYVEDATHTARYFNAQAHAATCHKVLSIGGGLDRLAVRLAARGCRVVCVDIAASASALTRALADRSGVGANVEVVTAGCEELTLPHEEYDLVLSKRRAAPHGSRACGGQTSRLSPTWGVFLAEEPVCLSRLMSCCRPEISVLWERHAYARRKRAQGKRARNH